MTEISNSRSPYGEEQAPAGEIMKKRRLKEWVTDGRKRLDRARLRAGRRTLLRGFTVLFLSGLMLGTLLAQTVRAQQGGELKIYVHEAESGEGLVGAHVWLKGEPGGAVTGRQGHARLRLPEGRQRLVASHVGYRTVWRDLDPEGDDVVLHIRMEPVRLPSEGELRVTSSSVPAIHSGIYSDVKTRSVDEHLGTIAGVDLVRRTNFARDPVIRGLRENRVEVVIDGMRMTPACVDGMDPLTAYLEPDNLEEIRVARGPGDGALEAGSSGGGIDFRMARPDRSIGLTAGLESGFHSVSGQQIHQATLGYGREEWGVRFSGTYRQGDEVHAGGGERIEGSSMEKGNLYISGFLQPDPDHTVTARYIGDFAGFIGYPALLMDTRRADAHLAGVEHEWKSPIGRVTSVTTRLYVSQVIHKMDDYRRNPSDRSVMRDMYMPMDGQTQTAGVRSDATIAGSSNLVELQIESWMESSRGDMRMIPTDPSYAEMKLLTLGDVRRGHIRVTGGYTHFAGNGWRIGGSVNTEFSANSLGDEGARAVYRSELPSLGELDPRYLTLVTALNIEHDLSAERMVGASLSRGSRAPDHMELYGYYVYQPLDGYFYVGNPGLDPEWSSQAELFLTWGGSGSFFSGRTALWANQLDGFITGKQIDDSFKRMENMGRARLTGVEIEADLRFSASWKASGQLSWTIGEHLELKEPLPMIPPLSGAVSLQWTEGSFSAEGRWRWAAAQIRIADRNHLETVTDGYSVTDLYLRWRISPAFRLQAGAENLLDLRYTDHLSVNEFPQPGRNLYLSLRWGLPGS